MEVVNGTSAGPEGRGLEHALDAWGKYATNYVNSCECQWHRSVSITNSAMHNSVPGYSSRVSYDSIWLVTVTYDLQFSECLGSYDPTLAYWHDTKIDQNYRSWIWMWFVCVQAIRSLTHTPNSCNEFGFWQDGAPLGWPSIVTRLITPQYDQVWIVPIATNSRLILFSVNVRTGSQKHSRLPHGRRLSL
jgi:hypothetical protein